MKNQYFGNRHDYIKYALIRRLTRGNGVRTAVCWMLTPPDNEERGTIDYLREPVGAPVLRPMDPYLFGFLYEAIFSQGRLRMVSVMENGGLLRDTVFYRDWLTDNAEERAQYFEEFHRRAEGRQLVFLDPDRGLETIAINPGDVDSSKYLFLDEVTAAFRNGHSLLIYQYRFPAAGADFVEQRANSLLTAAQGAELVYAFNANDATFFLVPHPYHVSIFNDQVAGIADNWAGFLRVEPY